MFSLCHKTKWKIFNTPNVKRIEYSTVLRRKREILHLINGYNTSDSEKELHYCSLFDSTSSSIDFESSTYDIPVIFLYGDIENLFLGLKIRSTQNTLGNEYNNLLLLLKQIKISLQYCICEKHIFVKSEKNSTWNAFYELYHLYLKRNATTNIGPGFYCSITLSILLEKEKDFLILFSKGLNVIKISKHSIFYTIYQRRKVSLQNFILMLMHMPNCLPQKLCNQTHLENSVILKAVSSNRILKMFNANADLCCASSKCKEISDKPSKPVKRKRNDENVYQYSKSKLFKSSCEKDNLWKIFNFKCKDFVNYSHLQHFFVTNNDQLNFDYSIFDKDNTDSLPHCNKKKFNLVLKCTYENNSNMTNVNEHSMTNKLPLQSTFKNQENLCPSFISEMKNTQMHLQQTTSTDTFSNFITASSSKATATDLDLFTTASGKPIHISDKAVAAAQKMFQDILNDSNLDSKTSNTAKKYTDTSSNLVKEEFENFGILADTFFQEISFDEEMEEIAGNSKKSISTNAVLNFQTKGKRKKSLGGRKNMKML